MNRLFGVCAPSAVVGATVAFVAYEMDNIFFKGKDDFSIRGLREEIKIDEDTVADKAETTNCETTSTNGIYDYIVCGSGPGAAAWLRTTLKAKPNARILLLERGPYCKTDILTESNPVRCYLDSTRIIAEYNHGVMQGKTFGGGTAVNNYAWITPSYLDLKNTLGVTHDKATEALVKDYENLCEELIGPRQPPHPLHQLLTERRPESVGITTNDSIEVSDTNRNKVILGAPTLNGQGQRRSSMTSIIEPLWRRHFSTLHIMPDTEVVRVIVDDENKDEDGRCTVKGVQTANGTVLRSKAVVVAGGALESPAILMRSGIGPRAHLTAHGVKVKVDNPHVGQHLRDKMLLDDIVITNNTIGEVDDSLLIVSRIFNDNGMSVQLHRYDKSTIGNSYLALTRMVRSSKDYLQALKNIGKYISPRGYSVFCFQTMIKMTSQASVTLDDKNHASLDASALFQEVIDREDDLRASVSKIYESILDMRSANIEYEAPYFGNGTLHPHFRLVWHFAGSCRVGDVLDPSDFSVLGVKGLHVVDMSACKMPSDGGTMAMAYLTGHLAATRMLETGS